MKTICLKISIMVFLLLSLSACIGFQPPPTDPWADLRQPDGTVTWVEEYNFVPPPKPWRILDLSETDFSLAFFNSCSGHEPGLFPCESTIAYAGEPFGYSQDLKQRQQEFFKRFLWASRLVFQQPKLEETTHNGHEALIATTIGTEPGQGQRVQSKVVFVKRGERVEVFFMNQWRSKDNPFDPTEFVMFDQFANSFKYVKPSFYETL